MEVAELFSYQCNLDVSIIVIDDRTYRQERPNSSAEHAKCLLEKWTFKKPFYPISVKGEIVVPESAEKVRAALQQALVDHRFVLTIGGTGLRPGSVVPEVTRELITYDIPGVATQILLEGLKSTDKAGLSRGLIGVTEGGALVANAPKSRGAVEDTLNVLLPLLPSIFMQIDERD